MLEDVFDKKNITCLKAAIDTSIWWQDIRISNWIWEKMVAISQMTFSSAFVKNNVRISMQTSIKFASKYEQYFFR